MVLKKKDQPGYETRMDAARALAKKIVDLFYLSSTDYAARFSVVSFNETATLRETWSTDDAEIDAAIDAISPDGKTSISNGLNLAGELLGEARVSATRVVLLLSDGEQSEDLGGSAEAIAAAQNLSKVTDKVFAWGFGDSLSNATLIAIAGDESRVQFTDDVSELFDFLAALLDYVCNDPPPYLLTGHNKCKTEFEDGKTACSELPTRKERKRCRKKNVDAGVACDEALYCPPAGTKS